MPANEKDLKVYAGLFEHVKETLKENGQTLNCDETGFINSIGTAPKKISYKEFENLEGEAFLSCAFLKFFQRLPLDEEKEKCASLSKEEILKDEKSFVLVNILYPLFVPLWIETKILRWIGIIKK